MDKEVIMYDVYNRVFSALQHQLKQPSVPDQKEGYFSFIPFYLSKKGIIDVLIRARKLEKNSFLDVGCGLGNIMLLAEAVGFRANGIEYREDYKDKMVVDPRYVFFMDAFKFENYGDYDVIYYYTPIANSTKMSKLEHIIFKQMKQGAFICAPCITTRASNDPARKYFVEHFRPLEDNGTHSSYFTIYEKYV